FPVRCDGADVPLVFQELQGGIDRPRRRRVVAAHFLLQRLDHLVAVPRLLLEQPKDHELNPPGLEHLVASPGAPRSGAVAPPPGPAEPGSESPIVTRTAHGTSFMRYVVRHCSRYIVRNSAFGVKRNPAQSARS